MQIAVATSSFRQPLRRSLETAARTGARGVQFDARYELQPAEYGETARRQLLHELEEHSLKVASLAFPLRRPLHDEQQLDRRLEALRAAMQFAGQLQCRVVTVNAMPIPDDLASRAARRIHEVLEDLARFGNRVGVTLALTPAAESPPALVQMLAHVRQGPIGIDFDPASVVRSGRNPADDLRSLASWISHCQVRDAVRGQDGDGKEVPVGRGEVDWPGLLAVFEEIGYRGWLTVRRTAGDDPVGDITRAVEYLRRVALGG